MRTIQRARSFACVGLLLLSAGSTVRGQAARSPNPDKSAWNNTDWKIFGDIAINGRKDPNNPSKIIDVAPDHIRNGSTLVKAEYVAMKVNDELIAQGIKPNTSSAGRVRALATGNSLDAGALANVTALRIDGEYRSGTDTGYLDNVALVPPGS